MDLCVYIYVYVYVYVYVLARVSSGPVVETLFSMSGDAEQKACPSLVHCNPVLGGLCTPLRPPMCVLRKRW